MTKNKYYIDCKPLSTGTCSAFRLEDARQYIPKLTYTSRFGDEVKLYKEKVIKRKKYLYVPRQLTPLSDHPNLALGRQESFENNFVARDDEQLRVVQESNKLIDEDQSFIVESPTGSGKTYMGAAMIAARQRRALIIVTKEDIKDQWVEALCAVLGLQGKDIGILQGQHCIWDKPVVIAMINSLCIDDKFGNVPFASFGFVLTDEVHRMGADKFSNCMWRLPGIIRVGMSASAKRSDGKDQVFKAHIGEVRVKSTQVPMIPKIIRIASTWSVPRTQCHTTGKLKPIPHKAGKTAHIVRILKSYKPRNTLITNFTLAAYNKKRSVIVFSELRKHLEILHEMFIEASIFEEHIGFYVGGLKKEDREEVKTRQILLATYKFCAEGTDIPKLDVCVLGTPVSQVNQIVGRVLRVMEGKKKPIVLDLLDGGSQVFKNYSNNRLKYYDSIGATVINR